MYRRALHQQPRFQMAKGGEWCKSEFLLQILKARPHLKWFFFLIYHFVVSLKTNQDRSSTQTMCFSNRWVVIAELKQRCFVAFSFEMTLFCNTIFCLFYIIWKQMCSCASVKTLWVEQLLIPHKLNQLWEFSLINNWILHHKIITHLSKEIFSAYLFLMWRRWRSY